MKIRVIMKVNKYYVQYYNSMKNWKNVTASLGTPLVYENKQDAINSAKSLYDYYNKEKVVWSSDEI